eukprot:7105432-Pyramimonas_sp.AAC.1
MAVLWSTGNETQGAQARPARFPVPQRSDPRVSWWTWESPSRLPSQTPWGTDPGALTPAQGLQKGAHGN